MASSRMRSGAFFRIARAMAMRCLWPPEKLHAALSDLRVVAVGEGIDEVGRVGLPCGLLDLLICGVLAAKSNVLADGVVEEVGVLSD